MPADALIASLKGRFAGNKSGRITINADEIAQWPQGLFEQLRAAKLLTQIEPARSLECRGCEEACFMPVNIMAAEGTRPARAFIACDKRDDVGRVRVDFARLHQWQITQSGFDKLQSTWIASTSADAKMRVLKKNKSTVPFRSALERLLTEIEKRSRAENLIFDRYAMPGRKCDFQALADKFDAVLEHTPRTFDDYLKGLCSFKRGARQTEFYCELFPEFFE